MLKISPLTVFIALFVLTSVSPGLFALDPAKAVTQYNVDQWTYETGLLQNSVTAVLQTSDGYLWVGSEEGLLRFDGVNFFIFDTNNTPAMTTPHIRCLFEDSRKNLWIGTVEGGLLLYQKGTFKQYANEQGLTNPVIYAIYEDSAGDIWIGTDGGGAFRLNLETNTFKVYTKEDGLSHNSINTIYTDSKGNLWFGTSEGLSRFKNGQFTSYVLTEDGGDKNSTTGDKGEKVNAIIEDSGKNLWIGTAGNVFRMQGDTFIKEYPIDSKAKEQITAFFEDSHHNLWIATRSSGVLRFRDGTFSSLGKKEGFPDDWTTSIWEDREGNVWIGSVYGGLIRLKDGKLTAVTSREGLADDIVWSILEDSKGYMWFGTNSGLSRYKDGTFKQFTTRNGLTHNAVDTVMEDSGGAIWAGTDGGLNRLPNPEANRFRMQYYLREFRTLYIPSILEDSAGNIWVGTLAGAVRIKNGTTKTFTQEDGLATPYVNFIHEDRKGTLWFSTLRGGLNKYENDTFTIYNTEHGLASNTLNCIYEDRNGVLWLGTNNGLSRFKYGVFFTFRKQNGLFNNNIYQILEDDDGILWMSGNKGIFKVRKSDLDEVAEGKRAQLKSIAYGKDDGMRSSECNGGYQAAGCKTRDGRLWFPTMKGAVVIDPKRIKTNKVLPPVHIERILLDGQPADLHQPVTILPGIKRLELHYTALSFVNPQKVKFKYKLEGYDEEWLDAGTRRATWYTNLDGGTYSFKVAACNDDGLWNYSGTAISITVIPPFWKTWWFILLAALAFAFLSYTVIHFSRKYISLASFWKKQKFIGKFKLLDKIGSGGMGTIYKANNLTEKSQTVALKVLNEDLFADENSRKRFKQEAAIIDQLDHPNIVKVYERGQSGQNLFIAMEYLQGKTLTQKILREKKIKLGEALHIMLQVSSALSKIHHRNIIHRDLKPDNIMLIEKNGNPSFVKLLDFGLAKMQYQTRLTQTGIVIGTINYMSPEQISGKGSVAASDIYSLGIIFYEMITGEKPFIGETTIDIMKQILDKSPIEPIRFRFDISFDLNHLIMRMLEKETKDRPDIMEVVTQLKIINLNIESLSTRAFKS
jgi:ligand-binding sensor domain-containing protein/predicted Ser/Thr protein kinase